MGLIRLLMLNGHLYLHGVWLRYSPKNGHQKGMCLKEKRLNYVLKIC